MSAPRLRLLELLKTHAYAEREVILASGKPSTFYIDCKQAILSAEGHFLVGTVICDLLSHIAPEVRAVGGLTMGADPLAFGIAAIGALRGRSLRSFSIRKEAKDHGVTGRVAGALRPGDRVVITEDTTSRGTTIAEAVEVVRAFGAEPVLVLALVDRGGTAARFAAEAGVPFVALATAPDLGFPYDGGA